MKKFTDSTENLIEPAIRVGSSIPSDAVNLGFYSGKEITSKNNLSYVDLSATIAENIRPYDSFVKLMFPNELGILEDENGNQVLEGTEISVSNLQLSKETFDTAVEDLDELNPNDYVHGYYVSRFFVMLPKYSYTMSSIEDFYDEKFLPNNIKVLDNEGKEYIDVNSGRKRYRILLEPFMTPTNSVFNEVPHKVIVLLDTPNPTDIKLIYDKVECFQDGTPYNQILKYSEKINAVRYFEPIAEEAQIVDPSNSNAKQFAVKRSSSVVSPLLGQNLRGFGKSIFVNKKALDDNRKFENFNWRMIVEISNSVQFDANARYSAPVKAGVLYSENHKNLKAINPYVFLNFQESPYNLNNLEFENPNSNTINNKSLADYWLVNIDTADLSSYDILVLTCNWDLTLDQGNKLKNFAANHQGTLVLDSSSRNDTALEAVDSRLSISSSFISGATPEYSADNLFLDSEKNNLYSITAEDFPEDYFGIFGKSITGATPIYRPATPNYDLGDPLNIKQYRYFDQASQSNTIFNFKNNKSLFTNLRFVNQNNPLTAGNIIATTTPLLDYCGNSWLTNEVSVSDGNVSFSGFQNSQLIEGPFKFLANIISVCVKDRILKDDTSNIKTLYSNKSYFVSSYGGDWTIYSGNLLNSEKLFFQEIISNDGEKRFSKDLTPSSGNIKEFFRYSFNNNIKFDDSTISKFFDEDYSNLKFYIEYTNDLISFTNTESVTEDVKQALNISDDSYVVKITNPDSKVYAYTDFESPSLYIPSGVGNHYIKDKAVARIQPAGFEADGFFGSVNQSAKRYPIDLSTVVSLREASELIPDTLSVTVPFAYSNARLKQIIKVQEKGTKEVKVPGTEGKQHAKVLATSEEYQGTVDVNQITNSYSYTYDIDEGNTSVQYKKGASGMDKNYIKYIQYTLKVYGANIQADGSFGSATETAVKNFQQDKKLRVSVNDGVGDGVVDSETKEALANFWLSKTDQEVANSIFLIKDENVSKYIRAARRTRTTTSALNDNILYGDNEYTNSTKVRMINFSNVDQRRDAQRHIIYVSLQIPTKLGNKDIDRILSLTINDTLYPVNFSKNQGSYQGIKINNYMITDDTNILELISAGSKLSEKKKTNYSKTKQVIAINQPLKKLLGKRILLEIEGSSIGGSFGNAEGIAIDNIIWNAITEDEIIQEEVEGEVEKQEVSVKAKISFSKTFKVYTLNESLSREISLPIKYTIKSIELFDSSVPSTNGTRNKTLYDAINIEITSRGKKTITLGGNNYRIDTTLLEHPKNPQFDIPEIEGSIVVKDSKDRSLTVNSDYFNSSMNGKNFVFQVKEEYLQSNTKILAKQNLVNFRLKNKSNQILPNGVNTVNYLDGTLLLANNNASLNYSPQGFDSLSNIRDGYSESVDVSISSIEVINNIEDQYGFVYGFYDSSKDKFIGTKLSYAEYISRGPQNVYVAVYANDFDGNIDDDFIGDLNSSKFPVDVSRKIVTPIYSVYSNPSNKIQLKPSLSNLQKTEAWPIRVTSGSFYKQITSTKQNYSTDRFYCKYDTSKIRSVAWSKIYGRGFYDVVGEKPEILSSRSIQLRQTPIHRVHEKTNLLTNFGALVKPVLKIYTRSSTSSPWQEIDYSFIRNIDCSTGLIEFNDSVVPNFDYLIKADYTIVCEDLLIKTDGLGNPIPINPFLNKDQVQLNKPLYIYMLPTEVYVDSNTAEQDANNRLVASDFVIAEDIKFNSIINFTYNNSIFNKNNSLDYNPFALLIGIIYTVNTKNDENFDLTDLRSRGGGISSNFDTNKVLSDIEEAISYWDVYPPLAEAYPKGGYIIVKIPSSVKDNFVNPEEVYRIVRSNMTAGVVFELKDMDGNDWSSS